MRDPPHPGRIIKTSLEDLGLSVTSAAEVLGVARPHLSKLLNGKAGISPEMAVRLSKAFGSTPDFWFRLQNNYDLAQARKRADSIQIMRYQRPEIEEISP
jgi:addiction module HigA family antidote